jgi:hypothetical protein
LAELLGDDAVLKRLSQSEPTLPEALNDRAQDIWEPLITLADEAGGRWPGLAREFAIALHSGGDESDGSIGVQLLAGIKEVWPQNTEAIASRDLVAGLCELDESPWAEWNGRSITPQFLAQHLKPYGIRSSNQRLGTTQAKGYERLDFEDPWSRYLQSNSEIVSHPSQTLSESASEPFVKPSHDRPQPAPNSAGTFEGQIGTFPAMGVSPWHDSHGTDGTDEHGVGKVIDLDLTGTEAVRVDGKETPL